MARLLSRRKKLISLLTYWSHLLQVVIWFFQLLYNIIKEGSGQIYFIFFRNRQIIHRLVYESEVASLDNLRINKHAFTRLCRMLETIGGLRASKYVCVDEQVAMFLQILAHHSKSSVIKFQFMRSEETVSKFFHKVLYSINCLHGELLKVPEPVLENSTDERWKWFKVYKTFFLIVIVDHL